MLKKHPKNKRFRRTNFSRTQLVIFALVFASIGSYFVWRSLAAGEIIYRLDWENGVPSDWGYQCSNIQGGFGDRGSFTIVNSPVDNGVSSARFDLPVSSDANACEMLHARSVFGDDYYSLALYFPNDWRKPSSAHWGLTTFQPNYQGIWGSPFSLSAHDDHVNAAVQSGYCVYAQGCTYSTGNNAPGNLPATVAIPRERFSRGVWHELVVHIRWADDATGVAEIWHRRLGESTWVKTVDFRGYPTLQHGTDLWGSMRNVGQDQRTHDKFGAYRGAADWPLSVYHDSWCRAVSFSAAESCLGSAPPPTVSLTANPTSITSGSSSTLSWNSTNATSCSASGAWSGSKITTGTQSVTPTATSIYSLTCTGSGGSASASTTVTVTTAAPLPPPSSSFTTSLTQNMTINTPYTWTFNPGEPTIRGQFWADGTLLRTIEGPGPYTYSLQPGTLTSGAHQLGHAWDTAGGEHKTPPAAYSVTISNPSVPPHIAAADLNNDGKVNILDLSILLKHYGTNAPAADINGDGVVNVSDLSILLNKYQ